jgi:dihydrolipoamide dehydrogenase
MATVYSALGSQVTIVEALNRIAPAADEDLVEHLQKRMKTITHQIITSTKVGEMTADGDKVTVKLLGPDHDNVEQQFDKALISIGRRPNSEDLGLDHTAIEVDDNGFIQIDHQRRTAEPNIFAIGDVAGEPMLAHKATYEARIAVEVIAGKASAYDPVAIPAVVFTDPELAWCGITETEAKARGVDHKVLRFPWAASGRATTLGRSDGLTKLIVDPHNERLIGVGIVGVNAGELIAEGVLGVETGALATDVQMTIHAHPTLSETLMEAAEMMHGASPHYVGRR